MMICQGLVSIFPIQVTKLLLCIFQVQRRNSDQYRRDPQPREQRLQEDAQANLASGLPTRAIAGDLLRVLRPYYIETAARQG